MLSGSSKNASSVMLAVTVLLWGFLTSATSSIFPVIVSTAQTTLTTPLVSPIQRIMTTTRSSYRWSSAPVTLEVGGISPSDLSCFAINSDGTLIALSVQGSVRLYDFATLEMQQLLKGHSSRVNHISWHPKNPQVLITASRATRSTYDSAIRIWSITELPPLNEHPIDRVAKAVASMALEMMPVDRAGVATPSGTTEVLQLVEGFSSALFSLSVQRDLDAGIALRGEIPAFGNPGFDTTGDCVLYVKNQTSIVVYNHIRRQTVFTLEGHKNTVIWAGASPDNTLIATSSHDMTVRLWDAHTGDLQHILTGATNQNWGAAFSANSQHVAAASSDGHVRVWSVKNGELTHIFGGFSGWVRLVAFSPESPSHDRGHLLAAAGSGPDGGLTCIFNISTGDTEACWAIETQHLGGWAEMGDLAYSHGGAKLGFKGPDSTLVVIDFDQSKTWTFASEVKPNATRMGSGTFTFTPDERMVWSLDADNVLRGWDLT